MRRSDQTEQIMDAILRELIIIGSLGAGVALPNLLVALDKPINKFLSRLDERTRKREARRIVYYMKSRGLVAGEYEFGLSITKKGLRALAKLDVLHLNVAAPVRWDKNWRIVFYDVPEKHKSGRNALTARLRGLGFYQLQRSVWIHPFPCRQTVEKLTSNYRIEKYVSYIETLKLDNQKVLVKWFGTRYPSVKF